MYFLCRVVEEDLGVLRQALYCMSGSKNSHPELVEGRLFFRRILYLHRQAHTSTCSVRQELHAYSCVLRQAQHDNSGVLTLAYEWFKKTVTLSLSKGGCFYFGITMCLLVYASTGSVRKELRPYSCVLQHAQYNK
jgi:hypothetical protein